MARMYVSNSSWFDSHKYDSNKMKKVVSEAGGKNIRLSKAYGWFNQPKVVCFNVTNLKQANKIQTALRDAFGTPYIYISKKDWWKNGI